MRRFADLHVKPSLEDLAHVHGMIDKSAELGFHMIGLSLPSTIGAGMVNQLQTMCHDAGTELATRVDLIPRGRRELLNGLRKLRHKFEIVNVFCETCSLSSHCMDLREFVFLRFFGEK